MARRMCTVCTTRPASNESPEGRLCIPCLRYAEAENEHSDYAHDIVAAGEEMHVSEEKLEEIRRQMKSCLICLGKPDPATVEPTKGHTNTQAKSYTSHAACDHVRTPKAREMCRRARRAAAAEPIVLSEIVLTEHGKEQIKKALKPTAGKMGQSAERATRSRARMSDRAAEAAANKE